MNPAKYVSKEVDDYRGKIRMLLEDANSNYIVVGLLLAKGIEEKYHQIMNYKRVEDMWEHELGLKASTGWNYLRVAKIFHPFVAPGMPDMTRLIRLLPFLSGASPEKIAEWYHKAKSLSPKDFNKEILVAQGKPDQDACEHKETETWERCKECGKWIGKK